MKKSITLFLKYAKDFGLKLTHLDDYESKDGLSVPYLEFSALKKTNLNKLLKFITFTFNKAKLLK